MWNLDLCSGTQTDSNFRLLVSVFQKLPASTIYTKKIRKLIYEVHISYLKRKHSLENGRYCEILNRKRDCDLILKLKFRSVVIKTQL